jgi:hypothetical protein
MVMHIRTHIDHRKVDGKYTDAHLYLACTKAQCNSFILNGEAIAVVSVQSPNIAIEAFNAFLGKGVFFEKDFTTWVEVGAQAGVYPEFLAALPKDFPQEHATNPERLVKILIA